MADVFISYKREERQAVERLAQELRRLGLDVWFDASLNAGEAFSDEIDREAHAAKVILVCWSPTARESKWVKSEALIGFEQGKLAACYVAGPDGFYPPTPFNSIHAEDLRAWVGAPSNTHAGYKSILRRIGALTGRADMESYGALDVQAPSSVLRAWIAAHARSPLFMAVDELLRVRDAEEAERGRLEQEARERRAREEAERRAREDEARRVREEQERLERAERERHARQKRESEDRHGKPNQLSAFLHLLLSWRGRASRKAWWLMSTLLWALLFSLKFANTLLFFSQLNRGEVGDERAIYIVDASISLLILWPMLATGAKRLHDQNRSAWWLLGPYGISQASAIPWYFYAFGSLGHTAFLNSTWPSLAGLASLISLTWIVVQLGFWPGSTGENRYGSSPSSTKRSSM